MGLLLSASDHLPKMQRGGQEHDLYYTQGRVFKITRNGVFGLSPGIELTLVATGKENRNFHLWEASVDQYLSRLVLQNELIPDLNKLEGVINISHSEIAILTSQPAFELQQISQSTIDQWFTDQGFMKVTEASYYRAADNLGIFDAHTKNVTQAEGTLIPFDVIPVRPDSGFLKFIEDSIAQGLKLKANRTTRT